MILFETPILGGIPDEPFLKSAKRGLQRFCPPLRMAQVGVQVDEGEEYEIPFHDPRVGEDKILGFKYELIVDEKIEVDESGAVFTDDLFAEGFLH